MNKRDIDLSDETEPSRSRRRFLGTLTVSFALSGASIGTVTARPDRIGEERVESRRSEFDIPAYPDDPFIQPSFGVQYILGWENHGYENVPAEEIHRTISGLHPSVLAFDQLTRYEDGEPILRDEDKAQLSLARKLSLPATSGRNVHITVEGNEADSRYGDLMEDSEWAFPDGTPLDSPTEILAETFDGEPQQTEFAFETLGTPSVFAPGGLELMIRTTDTMLERGFSGFLVDGVGVFRIHGLDFSRWARAAFRRHVESLSDDRLSTLGIESPRSFDVREYIRENGLTPTGDAEPLEDPIFREYLLHQHEGIDTWFDEYRNAIDERFPERMEAGRIALYANQFTGNFDDPQAANVYISDSLHVIYTELFPRLDPPVDVNYKLMRSVGNFSKPVVAKGTLSPLAEDQLGPIDTDASNTMFKRFQAAEAYASGARLQLPLTARLGYSEEETITNWVAGDGAVPEELDAFVNFLWAHERFLTDLDPSGDVALIWSLPTRIWRHEPTWNVGSGGQVANIDSFTGAATLLRELGFTYDVLTFGHPRLWDDTTQLNKLEEYETVVLAGVECLTDDQVSAIETYLDEGGSVLCSGPVPNRDGFYDPRGDLDPVFDREAVTVLEDDPGRQREADRDTGDVFADAFDQHGVRPVLLDEDPTVAVHAHAQSDPPREIIQLVSYDYDGGSDSFAEKTDLEVRLPVIETADPVVRYYSPQVRTDLKLDREGDDLTVTIPELVEWGMIVVTDDAERFNDGDAETARSRIEEADDVLSTVPEADRSRTEFVLAESQLSAAETALEYDAFARATDAAADAITTLEGLADSAGETPTDAESEGDGRKNPDEDVEGTDDDASGFGVESAIAGLGGVGYLLKRRLKDDSDGE